MISAKVISVSESATSILIHEGGPNFHKNLPYKVALSILDPQNKT